MAKVTIRNSKKMSEHEIKRELCKLRHIDIEESLQECIQELQQFEKKFGMSSVEFYHKFRAGKMGDSASVMRWAAQDAFRERLLAAYQRTCAVTGCDVVEALEAAHIVRILVPGQTM